MPRVAALGSAARVRASRALILIVAVATVACSQYEQLSVRSAWDRGADFSRLQTFAWLPGADAEPGDQRAADRVVDGRLRADVDRVLRAKGFAPAAAGAAPDFLLNYRITTDAEWGSSEWQPGWAGTATVIADDPGTLYLGVLDPTTRKLLWFGATPARLLPHLSMETQLGRVDTGVEKILKRFPPQ